MKSSGLSNQNIFPLNSITNFGWAIGIKPIVLKELAKNAAKYYEPFSKKKKDKVRIIDNPTKDLKAIQKKINRNILTKYKFPDYIVGGIKGKKPDEHLKMHVKRAVVITLDIEKCFPSISNEMIYKVWVDKLGCYPDMARIATLLTTYKFRLPLGSSTSNALAALVLLPALIRIKELADQNNLDYSQFVDDSAFSGSFLPDDFISDVCKEFSRVGLKVGRDKKFVMRQNEPQMITKKLVNRRIASPQSTIDKVRTAIFQLKELKPGTAEYGKAFQSIKGRIIHLKPHHVKKADQMLKKIEFIKKS